MLKKNPPLWFSLRSCEHIRIYNRSLLCFLVLVNEIPSSSLSCGPSSSQSSENRLPPCPRHSPNSMSPALPSNVHGDTGHCLTALEIMGTRRREKASLQANCSSSKLPPSPNVPFKRHDRDLKRSLLREGEKCRREKPLASLPPGCLQPPRLPHSRELPRRFEGLEGICDAIKTFLPAKHETPKVYGKPLSSGCLHIFRHPGSCSSKKPRKSKRPIMMVSGWRLCDYWLPHESLNFWDAEPISAAK